MRKMLSDVLFGILILVLLCGFAQAEVSLWSNQLMNGLSNGTSFNENYNSTVQDHIFYQFDDTSAQVETRNYLNTGIQVPNIIPVGRNKPISLQLDYSIMPLPFSMGAYGGEVDWCSLIVRHFKNVYDDDGNRINTTIEYTNINFTTSAFSQVGSITLDMRSDDTVSGDIYCHYTDVNALYGDNILVGRWTTYLPTFECKGCSDYSLETLTNELDTLDERLTDQNQIYSSIQSFATYDFQVWLIAKWIISIAFFFVAVYFVFYSIYFVYKTLKTIEVDM